MSKITKNKKGRKSSEKPTIKESKGGRFKWQVLLIWAKIAGEVIEMISDLI